MLLLAIGGLLLLGRGKWFNRNDPLGDPQTGVRDIAYLLIPACSNFYSAEGLAPTTDPEKNRTIFISRVTNRFDLGDEPPPAGYHWWDDARCFLFLPAKLDSNSVSILLLTAGGTNSLPDAWAAITYYRGNFEALSINHYSQKWLDTVMSRKPDFYHWRLQSAYLRDQGEEKKPTRTP